MLTKCDLADPSWIDLVEEDVRSLVRGTFLEGAAIVRTSAVTGQGLTELKDALHSVCAAVKSVTTRGYSGWRSTDRSPSPGMERL